MYCDHSSGRVLQLYVLYMLCYMCHMLYVLYVICVICYVYVLAISFFKFYFFSYKFGVSDQSTFSPCATQPVRSDIFLFLSPSLSFFPLSFQIIIKLLIYPDMPMEFLTATSWWYLLVCVLLQVLGEHLQSLPVIGAYFASFCTRHICHVQIHIFVTLPYSYTCHYNFIYWPLPNSYTYHFQINVLVTSKIIHLSLPDSYKCHFQIHILVISRFTYLSLPNSYTCHTDCATIKL